MPIPNRSIGADDLLDQRRLDELAAVGERGVRRRELQRRHGDLVAHRQRVRRLLRPRLRRAQHATRFASGYGSPVGVPKPKSRSVSNCFAAAESLAELHDADVARPAQHLGERRAAHEVLVVDLATIDLEHAVAGVDRIVSATRPRSSSPAAMNGFIVDPGSNGSVSTVADDLRGSRRRLAMARISPSCGSRMTMSPPSAPIRATASASDFSAISCRSALIVRTTLLPFVGAVPGASRRLAALPFRVPEDRRGARHAAQDRIERQLETVDRLVVGVHVTDDALRALATPRTTA